MKTTYGVCFVKDTGLFTQLPKELLDKIEKKSRVHNLVRKRGLTEELPIEGKVYIVHEGIAFLSCIDENGKKIILDILGKGSIFGDLDFEDKQGFANECLFIEPFGEAGVCEMKKVDFKEILKLNPEFAISLLSNLSKKLLSLEQKVGMLVFSDVEARLIAQIVSLGQKHGKETDNEIVVNLKLTHEKLAEMIGAARETVSENLSKLQKKEIVAISKDKIITLNKNKIRSSY